MDSVTADHHGRRSGRPWPETESWRQSSASTAWRYFPLWCQRFNPRFPANPPESHLNRACRLARPGTKFFSRSVVVASRGEGSKGSSRWRKPLKGSRSALRTRPTGRCAPLARESAGRKKQSGIRCRKSMRMDGLHPRMVVASGDLAISLACRGPSRATVDRAPRKNVTSVLSGTYEAAKSGNRLRRFLFGPFSFWIARR